MAKNYRLARQLVAQQGGLVDVAHYLKDYLGGPQVQNYLDERVEHWASILPPVLATKGTQADEKFQRYQRRRAAEKEFFQSHNPNAPAKSKADNIKRFYMKTGRNADGMVRVAGGRMEAAQAAEEGYGNVARMAQSLASGAERYEGLYKANEELITRMLKLFAEQEQTYDARASEFATNTAEDELTACTIDQRIILTRVFGKELMGKHARKKRAAKRKENS